MQESHILKKKQSKNADRLLSMAVKYNPALKDDRDKVTREYGLKLLQFSKKKPKKERRKYVDEAKKYVTQKDVDAVLPPPSWKTIFKKEYVGKGIQKKKKVKTVIFGKDYNNGDRITIIGNKFLIFTSDGWIGPEIKGQLVIVPKTHGSGQVGVRSPKGKRFTVKVERLIGSY